MNVFKGDIIPQLAHVGWGIALVLMFTPPMTHWHSVALVMAFALVKEFIESAWGVWEPKQHWSSSLRDFAFWCVGIGIAAARLYV